MSKIDTLKNVGKKVIAGGTTLLVAGGIKVLPMKVIAPIAIANFANGCDGGSKKDGYEQYHTFSGTTIEFYKSTGINVTQMDAIIADFEDAYNNDFNSTQKNNFKNKVTEIYITKGSAIRHTGTELYVGCNADMYPDIYNYLDNNGFFVAKNQQKTNVMLAWGKQNQVKQRFLPQLKKFESEKQA